MGDKNVNIGINFQINRQNLDNLQKSLDEVILKSKQFAAAAPDYAEPYEEAANAAKDLKDILTSSWNTQLGQLDLSKVERELINLYGSTKDFKNILGQIGPEGQKVFNQFTNAVISTQAPIKQTSVMLDKMAVTFKNTIRYGISSAIWNNFSRSVSKAYSYVKDLDKSLNDIRIVSGQSTEQMARFAVQANKAAQALGASTLDYTKGALIYYQQGLNDEEVIKRTDITVKMSNVLGRSAEEISNYMTAIWNNFYDGSKSLEYYADVLTKLGAETASSAEEISQGLEKFAAIGKTVGLSYEYAAAALTTVTDRTRQSAEVVGTAFKTLFARLQGLQLGETLEDGTNLNKYSEALAKVGISIKEETGELKAMDKIVEEMGTKWKTLDKDQQVALAQTVAGVRQYTQLISWMDNWDFFKENVDSALSSTGSLESQQSIYLDSIEAHLNQLDAAWEGLYNNIFDEDFMKTLTDALTDIIKLANTFVSGLGGGLNSVIYLAMTLGNIFSNQVSDGILRVKLNAAGAAEKIKNIATQSHFVKELQGGKEAEEINRQGIDDFLEESRITAELVTVKSSMKKEDQEALAVMEKQTQEYREQNEYLDLIVAKTGKDTGLKEKRIRENQKLTDEQKAAKIADLKAKAQKEWNEATPEERKEIIMKDFEQRQKRTQFKINNNNSIIDSIQNGGQLDVKQYESLGAVVTSLEKKMAALRSIKDKVEDKEKVRGLTEAEKKLKEEIEEEIKARQRQVKVTRKVYKDFKKGKQKDITGENYDTNEVVNALQEQNRYLEHNNGLYKDANNWLKKQKDYQDDSAKNLRDTNQKQINNNTELRKGVVITKEQKDAMNSIVSTTMILGTSISSVVGLFKTLANPDLSPWEQFTSIMSVLGTQMLMIVGNWENIQKILPSILVMTGKEATLEAAIASVKAKGLLVTIKEIALKAIEIIQDKIMLALEAARAIFTGKISALGIATVVALAAGAIALGAWVAHLIKINSEENKLKERVEKTAEAAQKVKDAYKEMNETVSSYKDAVSGIESLTEGTLEFYDAILKANDEAQKLIDKLGLVAGTDYTIDKNGLIKIDEEALEKSLFEEQQKVYQAQLRNTQARLALAEYNQSKTVAQFQQRVNTKSGLGRGFSYSQAESILDRSHQQRELPAEDKNGHITKTSYMDLSFWEDFKSTFKESTDNIKSSPLATIFTATNPFAGLGLGFAQEALKLPEDYENGIINITEEVAEFRAQYDKYSAEMLALQRETSREIIRAYGTKENVEAFNEMNDEQRRILEDYTTKQKNLNAKEDRKSGWASFWDTSDNGFWGALGIGALESVFNVLTLGIHGAVRGGKEMTGASGPTDRELKELYADNVLGYDKNSKGDWIDENGNKISSKDFDKIIKEIDLDAAKDAYASGEYEAGAAADKLMSKMTQVKEAAGKQGRDIDSQNYIGEAFSALVSGDTDYDFEVLEEEEFQILRKQLQTHQDYYMDVYNKYSDELQDKMRQTLGRLNVAQDSVEGGRSQHGEKRAARDFQNYNQMIDIQAEKLKTSSSALKLYDAALQNANKGTVKYSTATAEAAAANYKFNKAYNAGRKAFKDNKEAWDTYVKALQKGKKISYDVADGAGEIIESLKEMGIELSTKDLKDPESLKQINKLLSGTEKEAKAAYSALQDKSWVNKLIENLGMAESAAKEFVNILNSAEIGDALDLSSLTDKMGDTQKSLEDWKAWAEQFGVKVDVDIPEQKVNELKTDDQVTKTTHKIEGHPIFDSEGRKTGTYPAYSYDETITTQGPKLYGIGDLKLTKTSGKGGKNFTAAKSTGNSGGGGGKTEKKEEEKYNDKFDRYHVVNTQIEKVSNQLAKLQKQEEKTLGDKLLKNLNKQWNLLNTQIDNYKEKLKIAQGEWNELERSLSKKGVEFNEDGTVANYFEILVKQEEKLNEVIDWYNGLSAKDQDKKANQKRLEAAKEAYEEFKEELDRIDELASSEIPSIVQSIHDTIDEEIETNIKAFSLEVELSLDLKDAKQAWNEFKEQVVNGLRDEDIFGNAQLASKNLGTLLSTNGEGGFSGDLVNQIEHVNEIMQQIALQKQNLANVYGDNTKAALDDLKQWLDEAENSYEEVVEYQKQIHQSYLDMLDEAKEKLDEQIEEYERITSLLEHDKKLVELTYGEKAYAILDKYYKLQKQNNKDELKTLKAQQDSYKARMEAAEQAMKDAKIARDAEEEGTDAWKQRQKDYLETVEIFDKTKEQWEESVDKGNEKLEESIETGKESLENLINLLTLTLEQDLTGKTGGLGYAEEEWDLINRNADQYLDTINRLQGENQLESKYLDSINKATSPTIQKKIKDAMESEMKALREKDKLSQYDLDRANKRYQIMLAQIALEEAQQNKNKMRLRRDSQGNYRYQYVADEDAIKKAKEELSNLYTDLYNFDKERYKTTLSDIEATTKEFNEKLKELSQISDPDEKLEREKLLREEYEELFTAIKEQAETARVNLTDSAFDDLSLLQEKSKDEFLAMTEEETNALMIDLVPAWGSVYQAIVENLDPLNYVNDAINAQREAYEANNEEIDEYLVLMGRSKEEIGEALDENGKALDKNILKTQEFIKANEDLIETYETNLLKLEDLIKNTDDLIKRYLTETGAINKLAEAYTEWDSSMQDALDTYNNYSKNPTLVTDPNESNIDEKPQGDGKVYTPIPELTGGDINTNTNAETYPYGKASATSGTIKTGSKGNAVKAIQYALNKLGYGNSGTDPVDGVFGSKTASAVKSFQKAMGISADGAVGKNTRAKFAAKGYDTGGYTGSWGHDGRLAFLHQKELVLNAQDTENILNTVAIMRNLMASMNQDILSRLAGVSAGTVTNISGGNAGLEQNVHIDANFPNATNSNEIEEALRNLVNVASQRITK